MLRGGLRQPNLPLENRRDAEMTLRAREAGAVAKWIHIKPLEECFALQRHAKAHVHTVELRPGPCGTQSIKSPTAIAR